MSGLPHVLAMWDTENTPRLIYLGLLLASVVYEYAPHALSCNVVERPPIVPRHAVLLH